MNTTTAVRDGSSLTRVRAVTRAIKILRSFTPSRQYLTLGDIAKLTDLDAGTTRRLLITLRDEGLVRQDRSTGLYSTSIGLLELASAVPKSLSLTSLIEERINALAHETQTTVYVSTVSEDMALCLARCNGGRAIEVQWWSVGERRPFNVGTGPRVLLAFQSTERQEQIINQTLALDKSQAIVLKKELEQIRSQGVIVKHDEIASGLSAMAVPLLDNDGNILASISTGGLTPKYSGAERVQMYQSMVRATEDMRESLRGYST
jgi:IclR family acetate operon transcriptional repressor